MLGSYKEKFTLRNSNSGLKSSDIKPTGLIEFQLVKLIKLTIKLITKRV